jgi:hypothetical protein
VYTKLEDTERLTSIQTCEKYPDNYVLMRMDSRDPMSLGDLLFIGDEQMEMLNVMLTLNDGARYKVIEGTNFRKRYLL